MNDFDFLAGTWSVQHRRLNERLSGCDVWEAFDGTTVCRSILGGVGNFEEVFMPSRGAIGSTLRLFDSSTRPLDCGRSTGRAASLAGSTLRWWAASPAGSAPSTETTSTTTARCESGSPGTRSPEPPHDGNRPSAQMTINGKPTGSWNSREPPKPLPTDQGG